MIVTLLSTPAKTCVSHRARSFAASRKTADPRTEKCSLLINHDKQPTVVHRPDGSQIVTTYDGAGRVATVTYPAGPSTSDGNITVTRNYHPTTGKLSGMSSSDGQSLTYGYDGSLPLSTTWSGTVVGSVSLTYDNNFRVVSESVNGANTVALGHDDDGLLTSIDGLTITRDPANGLISDASIGSVTNHRTYDNFGQMATNETKFGATSLYSVAYVRDSLGRIEQKTETIQGTTTVWVYSYDTAGRLWQVMKDGVLTSVYGYGANGNRLTKTTSAGTETATYDDQDRLLTYGKWAYTYTANGELRTKTDTTIGDVTTYSYDGQGNLRRVTLPDGRLIEYVVDGENRRVGKKVNGTLVRRWLFKDSLKPAAELDGAGTMLARYVDGLVIKGSNTYKVVADHLGTPRLLIDRTTGAVAQRLDFDEFGQITSDSSPGFQTFGLAGGIYDADTGLVRFGARDYDPETGRWTAKDPIRFEGGDMNLFGYAHQDPVNNVDRTGKWAAACAAAIAACVGYAAYQGYCKVSDMKTIGEQIRNNEEEQMSLTSMADGGEGPQSCRPQCDQDAETERLRQEQAELVRRYADAHQFDGIKGHWKDVGCAALVVIACLVPSP